MVTSAAETFEALSALPRLGLMAEFTPVTPLPGLARELGLDWLGVKRDDACPALHGGSKVRKLDYLLAAEPYRSAEVWTSVGAVGSGHLVALTAAAEHLDRRLIAHCFWEPVTESVRENLAFIASGPTELRDHASRVHLALTHPSLLLSTHRAGIPVIPPGGSNASGIAGMVRGGLELALQIEAGEIPIPDAVYVALGSGGTAVGIALGLALADLRIPVRAVAAVERPFAPMRRMQDLLREAREWLVNGGIGLLPLARDLKIPIEIVHGWVGPGYGVASELSLAACERLSKAGVDLEPLYSGKAMSALLRADNKNGRVLFWLTPRRFGPLPHRENWQDRLPARLRKRLRHPERTGYTRRHAIALGSAAIAGLSLWGRTSGYSTASPWLGRALAVWEAQVLTAAAEALLPPDPSLLERVAGNVDRYVEGLPVRMQREIHAMLALIEHGTTPLAFEWSRFSSLPLAARTQYLDGLSHRGGVLGLAYRGLRDLAMLGYYQEPRTWEVLGYGGPLLDPELPVPNPYAELRAPKTARPRGWSA